MGKVREQVLDSSNYMEKISFDVLNYILSFLPPIPHLFRLQRVNHNWRDLCQLCLREDARCVTWTGVVLYNQEDYEQEQTRMKNVVFKHFSNIQTLELCGVVITAEFLSECEKKFSNLEHLSLSGCLLSLEIKVCHRKGKDEQSFLVAREMSCIGEAWKRSMKKITLKNCLTSMTALVDEHLNPVIHSSSLFFIMYSMLMTFPGLQVLDAQFALGDASYELSSEDNDPIRISDMLGYNLTCKVHQISPHRQFVNAFTERFPTNFESSVDEVRQEVQQFRNEFWRDYLAKHFKFSKSRIDTLIGKYYSSTMKEHVVDFKYYDTQLNMKYCPIDIPALISRYPAAYDTLTEKPKLTSSYDLGMVAPPLIIFLNNNPYFGIDPDLTDDFGFNLIHHATSFNNIEVLLFLLRYFNEFRLEQHASLISKDKKLRKRQHEEIDQQYLNMLHIYGYTGKSPVLSCFASSRTCHLFSLMLYGANVNQVHHQTKSSILHELAKYGQIKIIDTITEHEIRVAEILATEEKNKHPLGLITNSKSTTFRIDWSLRDAQGQTPQEQARANGMNFTANEMQKYIDRSKPAASSSLFDRLRPSKQESPQQTESLQPVVVEQTVSSSGQSSWCIVC